MKKSAFALVATLAIVAGCDTSSSGSLSQDSSTQASKDTDTMASPIVSETEICMLYSAVVEQEASAPCIVEFGDKEIKVSGSDGATPLTVPMLETGQVYTPKGGDFLDKAEFIPEFGAWKNYSGLFVAKAGSEDLCVTTDVYAPNGGANSFFVLRPGQAEKEVFSLSRSEETTVRDTLETPVAEAGKSAVFALTRREPAALKSIEVNLCPGT